MAFLLIFGSIKDSQAEEFTISIPFGAFNPELNTPAEVWYDPPILSIQLGDTVTWINDDREGHTVTSGEGSGRFEWMNTKELGEADGIFDSQRFMPNESWAYTFDKAGVFNYFCIIHPWMSGVVTVNQTIPDYPHDAYGNRIESFPVIQFTPDKLIEFDLTWEPNIIKTFEKTTFVFQTYDGITNSNLDKMMYDMIITQNGKEVFQDSGITQVGGDYRNVIFENSGPIEIRFQNIVSSGSSGIDSIARESVNQPLFRTVVFSTIVYDNPEKITTTETMIQPAQRLDIYYELLVAIILVPALMLLGIIIYMKFRKSENYSQEKSTPL
ncbi:MAG: hypothetical protein HKP34_03050 [Nitrosopumilus sp.]|nr:hypothetical protein [Nitrosopumilus sp.]NNL37265.1 hypothetical protein [Nitrosopumilus sp.]